MPESLDKRLLAYTLVAGAGLAGAPELAQAAIVYTNPNPDTAISSNGQFIDLDLNNDGTADARVSLSLVEDDFDEYAGARVRVGGNGQPTKVIGNPSDASALLTNAPISSLQSFQDIQSSTRLMAGAYLYEGNYYRYGEFGFGEDRFLGLTFQIDGAAHFGWARFGVFLNVGAEGGNYFAEGNVFLRDYAFEDCAREGILADARQGGASCPSGVPMPPALALVALGVGGLALWRARQREGE